MRLSFFKQTLKNYYPQFVATTAVTILTFEVGLLIGWLSPYLARLEQKNSTFPLTPEQGSWVVSSTSLGLLFGSFTAVLCISTYGSKCTLLLAVLPISCSWICVICAKSAVLLYFARLTGGIGHGMTYCSLSMYVGEIALPKIRGAVVSAAFSGGTSFGILVSSIYGSYQSMSHSAEIYLVPCILVIILFFYLPDSPHWLVKVKKYEAAKRSIVFYNPTSDPDVELRIIKELVEMFNSESFYDKFQRCFKPGPVRKALILIIVLFTFMQLTGMANVVFNMENIFIHNKLTIIKPSIVVVYVNVASIVATILSMYLIDKIGRKFLLILSCSGIFMSMSCLGVSAYLVDKNYNNFHLEYLTIISVFGFMSFFFIGMISVPNTVLGEIFPSDMKNIAAFVGSISAAIWSFICTKSFQPFSDLFGEAYVFWIHGACALILAPFVYFYMFETKGKSLAQIQCELMTR